MIHISSTLHSFFSKQLSLSSLILHHYTISNTSVEYCLIC
nr:MAG TPA: hypothetical protein [Crassvirales sp.]